MVPQPRIELGTHGFSDRQGLNEPRLREPSPFLIQSHSQLSFQSPFYVSGCVTVCLDCHEKCAQSVPARGRGTTTSGAVDSRRPAPFHRHQLFFVSSFGDAHPLDWQCRTGRVGSSSTPIYHARWRLLRRKERCEEIQPPDLAEKDQGVVLHTTFKNGHQSAD